MTQINQILTDDQLSTFTTKVARPLRAATWHKSQPLAMLADFANVSLN